MLTTKFNRIAGKTLLAVGLVASGIGLHAQGTEPTLPERLAKLTRDLEAQRQELHIPGMAMAVVQGDELIYSHGFGSADLENGTPVTPETLFAIGSSTKAFTASLIGMLVDEGKMSWDDPVTKFLPYFELKIDTEDPEATVTIRDLLAHRTGFTRMGLLWAGGAVSREEVLRTATRAEPWSPFREKFFYNNVAFLAAGMASSVAAGTSWDELLADRLLSPLGMESSSSSIGAVQGDARLSRGYVWKEESEVYEHLPMRKLDSIAPAGGINSNVLDMAQWLRFQLGHGTFGDEVLLSETQHAETWTKQIEAGPGVDYGLGWMMRSLGDRRLVEHGGNIDGFSAEVALFPDDDLGFVLLTNVTATPLQSIAPKLVADALLTDWTEEEDGAEAEEDLGIYAGRYEANFASWKDTHFTVSVKGSRLSIDVPNQMDYQLEPPDDEGKWYFSLTDQIAIAFDRDADGSVVGLKMYQSGMTFELPREGVERQAEIELSTLRAYLGTYHSDEDDFDVEVKISNKRLAVDVPDQMVFELFPPDDEGKWFFRATDKIAVWFDETVDGRVNRMKMFQNGVQSQELTRVEGTEQAELPTAEEILGLRSSAGDTSAQSFRITGRVRLVHAGLDGTVTYTSDGSRRFRSDTDFGRFGWTHQVVTEEQGWVDSNIQPFRQLEGKYLTQAKVAQALLLGQDWLRVFDSVTVVELETVDDRQAYELQLRVAELPTITAFVDVETGDLLRYEMTVLDPGTGIAIRTVNRQEDFRDVEGLRVPFRRVSRNDFTGETVFELEKVETGVEVDEGLFSAPDRN